MLLLALLIAALLTACAPTPEGNVIGYYLARRLGTLNGNGTDAAHAPPGSLSGTVVNPSGEPVAGATVLVASRTGQPFAAQTGNDGSYTIAGVPPGQYVPASVAPGYEETMPQGWLNIPYLATVESNTATHLPTITLQPHLADPLPAPLPSAVNLQATGSFTASSPFPAGAISQVYTYRFDYRGTVIDSLRVYLPLDAPTDRQLPTLFMIYPTAVESWESVSVGFAVAGYAFVAVSPSADRALDIDAHAQDARVALALARGGHLHPAVANDETIVLGGSFSSAIQNRLMRDEDDIVAWITVGGISNAFSGAYDFYHGILEMPPQYELLIPALGAPNLYPMLFLRYSPVYTAAQFPPSFIIHTASDKVSPIDQAYQLETALKAAGVPTWTFYYEDVSHNLPIGEHLTPEGEKMYALILEFAERYQSRTPMPSVTLPATPSAIP